MNIKLAEDAKPQIALLLIATVITIILWFLPYAEYIVYPIRLFVTFIHEAAHALAAILTGGSVHSLTISPDGSGSVYSAPSGWLGLLITASAGYLGTTLFGVGLLVLIRKALSPNKILIGLGAFVALITLLFGVVSPLFNFLSLQVSFGSVAFTIVSGVVMSLGLLVAGRYLTVNSAQFAVAFLAVQCLLNALSDLKTLFMINAPLVGSNIQTDAANMAAATGLPAIVWVMIWLVISVVMIGLGLRIYAAGKIFASGRSNP